MKMTERAVLELAYSEGLVRQAYRDSVGTWTWSIGITNASGHNVERYINNPQPLEHCLAVFVWALQKYADDVDKAFSGVKLSEAQFAAALSFHYNTGAIGRASWVTKFKAGDIAGARAAFMDWKKPPEIIERRTRECNLFFDGKWSGDGTVTEYTQVTAKGTIVWGSAKRVDITKPLRAALAAEAKELPSGGVVVTPEPAKSGNNLIVAIATVLGAIGVAVAKMLGWM